VRRPSSAFFRLARASCSTSYAALFHATDALGVSTLQGFSLSKNSTKLVTWRFPLGVPLSFRCTSKLLPLSSAAPSGLLVFRKSVPDRRSISSTVESIPSWALSPLRFSAFRLGVASLLLIRSCPSKRGVQAHPFFQTSASSHLTTSISHSHGR
jgi:hypothetical protein